MMGIIEKRAKVVTPHKIYLCEGKGNYYEGNGYACCEVVRLIEEIANQSYQTKME